MTRGLLMLELDPSGAVRVAHGATGSVADILADLLVTANLVRVPVHCAVMGVPVVVEPGTDPEAFVRAWRAEQGRERPSLVHLNRPLDPAQIRARVEAVYEETVHARV